MTETNRPRDYNPGRDILPIFIGTPASGRPTAEQPSINPISHEGTGFLIGKNVLVTCWHCVEATPPPGARYYVATEASHPNYDLHPLIDIERDPSGKDLATATVSLGHQVGLALAENAAPGYGTPVWSFGYPLTDVESHPDTGRHFSLNGRLLQGYTTRAFRNFVPRFGETLTYEIDMPSPRGASGSPILEAGTSRVIGVLYGTKDVETIEEVSTTDPQTGSRTPEVVRITAFAAAHITDTLKNLRGTATNGAHLADFLKM